MLEWLLRRRRLLLLLQLAPAALAVRSRLRLLLLLQLAGAAPAARSHSAALVRHRSAASHVGARLIARYSARHSAQQRRPLTPPIGPSKDEFASNAGGLRASHTMLDKSLPRCDPGKRSRRSLRTANVRGVRFTTPFRPPSRRRPPRLETEQRHSASEQHPVCGAVGRARARSRAVSRSVTWAAMLAPALASRRRDATLPGSSIQRLAGYARPDGAAAGALRTSFGAAARNRSPPLVTPPTRG